MKTKNRYGLITAILLLVLAVPFWVGALSNQAPHIQKFTVDDQSTLKPGKEVIVNFKAFDQEDSSLDAQLYFGDGESKSFSLESGVTVEKEHNYKTQGDYRLRLKVEDSEGARSETSFTISIEGESLKIDTFRTSDKSTLEPHKRVYFEYRVCAPEKEKINASIHFGDGESKEVTNFCSLQTISHKYDKHGDFEAKLTANYYDKKVRSALKVPIWVEGNKMPEADFNYRPSDIEIGDRVKFNNLSEDPDSETHIASYKWSFGDKVSSDSKNPVHIYNKPGTYKVTLTVTDSGELKDKKWFFIRIYPKFQSGRLVRIPGTEDVYRTRNGRRHWIPSPAALKDYGYKPEDIEPIMATELADYPRIKHIRKRGDKGRIFYITRSQKIRQLPNQHVFFSYGNKLKDVVEVSETELKSYDKVRLIKYGNSNRIYKIDRQNGQLVKHWVTSPEAFEEHGFEWKNVAPVNWTEINAYPTADPIK